MKMQLLATVLFAAAGSSLSLAQTYEECVKTTTGTVVVVDTIAGSVNLCPSVGVARGPEDANQMIFAWGSASIFFHGGSTWASPPIPALPEGDEVPAQVFVRRYSAAASALEARRGIVSYTGDRAWGHQYPSIALQRFDEPPSSFGPVDPSRVALTFGSDFSGFSKVAPSADSRVVYVSSSEGDDQNDGYSPHRPKETIEAGHAKLRQGYPDQLLLKRGDNGFELEEHIWWGTTGRNQHEPSVLAGYGRKIARPVINVLGEAAIHVYAVRPLNIHVNGVAITAPEYDGFSSGAGPVGISLRGLGGNWIEDCRLYQLGRPILMQGPGDPEGSDGLSDGDVFRRCTFWNITSDHGNGANGAASLYQIGYTNSLIEECFFGAAPSYLSEPETRRGVSQAVYNQSHSEQNGQVYEVFPDTQAIRGNISFNSGRGGFAARSGGLIERNVAIRHAQGFSAGYSVTPDVQALMRYNLCVESRDGNPHSQGPQALGLAFEVDRAEHVTLFENIAAHATDGNGPVAYSINQPDGSSNVGVETLTMFGNIAFNWMKNGVAEKTLNIFGPFWQESKLDIQANELMQHGDTKVVSVRSHSLPDSRVDLQDNWYHCTRAGTVQDPWFVAPDDEGGVGRVPISNATWEANIESSATFYTGANWNPYPNSGRNVESYAQQVTGNSTTEDFVNAMQARNWGSWNPAYTAENLINYIRAGFGRDPLPSFRLGPYWTCGGGHANMLHSFDMIVGTIPQVADTSIATCSTGPSLERGRASIAYSGSSYLRVGATLDSAQIWYAFNNGSPAALVGMSSGWLATTPCVSAAADDSFVAVWIEYNGDEQSQDYRKSRLKMARFIGSTAYSPITLLTNLNAPPHEHAHDDSTVGAYGWVQHGAREWVVPASVACLDDGSFAVSYSDGNERWVRVYTASLTPTLGAAPMLMDTGFAHYNHCVAASGASLSDSDARIVFVGVAKYGALPWAPYFRTYMPYPQTTCKPGRPHLIPLHQTHNQHLSLGPAFAHPAAIRPDGKLVVTWSTMFMQDAETTALGFSLVDLAGTYCPTDLDCDGTLTSNDTAIFDALYLANDPFANWNCDGHINAADITAFYDTHALGCR